MPLENQRAPPEERIVAANDLKTIAPMELIAVLAGAVREQQRLLSVLTEQLQRLDLKVGGASAKASS